MRRKGGGTMSQSSDTGPVGSAPARWFLATIETIGGISMLIIVVVIATQVVMRYVFNASLIWAEELCRYVLIWMTFLLIGVAFHRGELVAVELVSGALPPRWRFALKVAATIPVVVFLGVLVFYGFRFASRMGIQTLPAFDFIYSAVTRTDDTVDVSIFWLYVSVPAGCALLIAHMLISLALEARGLARGVPARTPAPAH
jgi:TRAP-type C4-dicarboxylate transport system permease small subunit